MSKSRLNRANVRRLALTAMIGTAFLATSVPAFAEEAEDDGFDIQIIRRVLSAVGLRDDKPPIDYRERSPLVVPPSTSLPAPMSGNVAAPNWPVDPEIKEQRIRNAASKAPGATGDPVVDDGKPLRPSELAKGRAKRGVAAGPVTEFPTVSQKELGSPNVFSFFSKAMSSTEKEESKTEETDTYNRREYSYNNFSRSFYLPDTVERDKVEARYENGVLRHGCCFCFR